MSRLARMRSAAPRTGGMAARPGKGVRSEYVEREKIIRAKPLQLNIFGMIPCLGSRIGTMAMREPRRSSQAREGKR